MNTEQWDEVDKLHAAIVADRFDSAAFGRAYFNVFGEHYSSKLDAVSRMVQAGWTLSKVRQAAC